MDDSEALIVICSPAARASLWVNEEIRRFRLSGQGHHIFCLIVAGSPDPNAADCAFPTAILQDENGNVIHEPLAADATSKGDGKRNAMLKIAAGLLGVGVDDLKQRDAQRQARFWSSVATGAIFIAALTIGLAIYAFKAEKESELRRQQAESLIGFMLGDLRKKLEPIGKLELLDSVGDQAIKYFATLGNRGTPKEMLARAVALKQIGDVRFNQGKLEPALKAFEQSLQQARELYKTDPQNNDYLYELGQAEFWVGYVAWERGDLDQGEINFNNYMRYSRELLDREPGNSDYNMELSYAYSNLGSLARARGNSQVALDNFILSADINAAELKKQPDNSDLLYGYAEALSWIGSTKADLGDLQGSEQAFNQISTLLRPIHDERDNARVTFTLASNLAFQAEAKLYLGDIKSAKELISESLRLLEILVAKDPQNAGWLQTLFKSQSIRLSMIPQSEWTRSNDAEIDQLNARLAELSVQDPSNSKTKTYRAAVMREKALRALQARTPSVALTPAKTAYALMHDLVKTSDPSPQLLFQLAKSAELLGTAMAANQQMDAAESVWRETAELLDKQNIVVFDFYPIQYLLAVDLKQTDKAKEIERKLEQAGFKDPRMQPAHTLSGTFR